METTTVFITVRSETAPAIEAPVGAPLSQVLDRPESPVFFGCKTGNCGTCLVEVSEEASTRFPAPGPEERDWLETLAPGNPRARLACQLTAVCDFEVAPL